MPEGEEDILEMLKFELKFLEDGGYGRSPQTPWRPTFVFEDSPSCPNFNSTAAATPCSECQLTKFIPEESRDEERPCRFIRLTDKGQTVEYFYHYGTQPELEEALKKWLRQEIVRIEGERASVGESRVVV